MHGNIKTHAAYYILFIVMYLIAVATIFTKGLSRTHPKASFIQQSHRNKKRRSHLT